MKYCIKCGVEIMDESAVCNNCGGIQNPKDEKYAVAWSALGFCFPVIGVLLYMIWKSTMPKSSKYAGIGAVIHLIAIGAFFLLYVFVIGLIYLYNLL